MAKHEFALMDQMPQPGVRYDTYETAHLRCVSVEDDLIGERLWEFRILPCFAHTVDLPWEGLCCCGITLIPPHTAREMRWMVCTDAAFSALTELLDISDRENKWIIHFGL